MSNSNEYELPADDKGKLSILVVDDEKSNIVVINHILGDKYNLFVAKSGEAAIKVAHESHPDLILLDVVMPDMNGFQVLSELKKSDMTRNIPVIFITGQNSSEDEVKGLKLGAADYITKPIVDIILEARIHTHMQNIEQMRTIRRMSTTDELTGLPNRRYFNDQINREWNRSIRETSWISLLLIDIDRFKIYNDTYGHQQGDALLQAAARIFKGALKRTPDVIARWGGEEFAMLLPRTASDGAVDVAERIRDSFERLFVPLPDGTPTNATLSIGINSEQPIINELPASGFISKADKALYLAKKTGRNRVCAYQNGGCEDAINYV